MRWWSAYVRRWKGIFALLAAVLVHDASADDAALRRGRTDQAVSASHSNDVAAHDPPLTLDVLESLALQYNPTLAQAAAAIEQQRGNMVQVGLYPNPQVGYLRTDSSPSGNARTNGAFFGQEIVTAGKLRKSRDTEAQEVERLGWEQEAQRQRVVNDVRIRYYDLLAAQRAIQLTERLLRLAEQGVETAEQLLEAKVASKADVLQARIQLKTVRISIREAQARYRSACRQLTNVVGCPDLQITGVAGTLDGGIPQLDWDTAWEHLLAASPQLRAAEFRIQHARFELTRERAQPWPNLTAQIVAERDNIGQFTQVSTLLAVPVPIFNRNQGNIAHATADILEAAAEVRRTELALRDLLADAFRRYETNLAQVEELRDEILPDAKESLELTTESYKGGQIALLQLLTARQTYFQSNLAYVEALAELRKTIVEIDGLVLTGGLNPATLGTALQSQAMGAGRQRGLLNQIQEGSSNQLLPPAIQAASGGP